MKLKGILKRVPGVVDVARLSKSMVSSLRRKRLAGRYGLAHDGKCFPDILVLPDSRHRFVGYYDHSPFKPDDERLMLVHSTDYPAWRRPSPDVPVTIELISHRDKTVVRQLGESYAWNWQQGARALWLNAETVIFNVYDSLTDRYRARMVHYEGSPIGDLPIPVQEVDSLGRVYGLSYEALAAIRPDYGYRNRKASLHELTCNAIERFDPATKFRCVLVYLSDLQRETTDRYGCSVTRAKFNHLMASPDATRLVFLFRYFVNGRRVTDLYEISTDGGTARLLVADSGVSHVCWWGNDKLIATMKGADGFGYYAVSLSGEEPTLIWRQQDGHPSSFDGRYLLTDTYPDKYAYRRLLIRALDTGDLTELGCFPEPLLYHGETRCDLHPSLSPTGRLVQVDCAVGHRRAIAVLENPMFVKKDL